jgi:hypothetical protein
MNAAQMMSAARRLTDDAPVLTMAEQIQALEAQEARELAAWQDAHIDGASPDELARLDAARKATRAKIEGLEGAQEAQARREIAEAKAREEADRLGRAVECDALLRAIVAEGEAMKPALSQLGEKLRELLARADSLVFVAGTHPESRNLLRARVISLVAFALKGVISHAGPEAEPPCPFARFADDLAADLARVGLALPTPTTTTEEEDHA